MDSWKEDYEENDLFSVMGIVQLENPPKNKKGKSKNDERIRRVLAGQSRNYQTTWYD